MSLTKPIVLVLLALTSIATGWYLGSRANTPVVTEAAARQTPAPTTRAGVQTLPAIDLTDLGGATVNLQQFEGRPVVVNLWATWCPPCRREMPVLEQAAADNPDVAFVFANQAEPADMIRDFIQGEGLDLEHVLLDTDSRVARHFQARALPTTLFFGADGKLENVHMGEVSGAQIDNYLRETQ